MGWPSLPSTRGVSLPTVSLSKAFRSASVILSAGATSALISVAMPTAPATVMHIASTAAISMPFVIV